VPRDSLCGAGDGLTASGVTGGRGGVTETDGGGLKKTAGGGSCAARRVGIFL